ncbi:MAG: hypothetical protein WBA17_18450, partial [Saprospiraceae bacterium]
MRLTYFLFFLLFIILPTLSAQIVPPTDACLQLKYPCTKAPAPRANATVTIGCPGGGPSVFLPSPFNSFCYSIFQSCAPADPDYICLNDRNWLFCEQPITNNELYVVQQLPRNTSLNGTILGDFPQETVVGDQGICLGPDYGPFTNTLDFPTDIYKCPEDPVILRVPDLQLPNAAGLCLFVSVYSLADSLLAAATYNLDDFSGDEVDVSGLLNPLGDGHFIFELSLRCCELPVVDCPVVNATRRTYIRVFPDLFAYKAFLRTSGIHPTDCINAEVELSTISPGDAFAFEEPFCNLYSFIFQDVHANGVTSINIKSMRKVCDSLGDYEPFFYEDIAASDLFSSQYVIEPKPDNKCYCYRFELNYTSVCTGILETFYHYYRIGQNCSGAPTAVSDDDTGLTRFTLFPNPAAEVLS